MRGCLNLDYLKNTTKIRLYQTSKLLAIFSFIGSLLIFVIAINEISKAGIGNIIGNGYIDIGVPGESQIYSVLSNWDSSIGFYLYLVSTIILSLISSVNFF